MTGWGSGYCGGNKNTGYGLGRGRMRTGRNHGRGNRRGFRGITGRDNVQNSDAEIILLENQIKELEENISNMRNELNKTNDKSI